MSAVAVAAAAVELPRWGSFEEAYAELGPVAYRAAHRLLGDREQAAEVAQEAMARLVPRWRSVGEHPAPEAWAATVATRLVIGGWRRRRRPLHAPAATGFEGEAIDRADLVAALRALPRRQREVAVLLYVADLSVAEVAAQLGCADGTVKQHAARARAALRAALGA